MTRAFEKVQDAWEGFKKFDAELHALKYEGGTMASLAALLARKAMTEQRLEQIQALHGELLLR